METLSYRKLPSVAALPTPAVGLKGVIVRLTTDDKPYHCDGVKWEVLSAPRITVGTSAPSSPEVGDLWVDTN